MREGESLDERLRKELLRSELKERNNGKKIIRCKYRPKYPDSAEREYVRLINAYMTIEKEVLMKYIPEIKQILNDGTQLHTDSNDGIYSAVGGVTYVDIKCAATKDKERIPTSDEYTKVNINVESRQKIVVADTRIEVVYSGHS